MAETGDPTNKERAARARGPLDSYVRAENEGHGLEDLENCDQETELVDFITDLMHLADELGLDFAAVILDARQK